jgi:hypothetical protein
MIGNQCGSRLARFESLEERNLLAGDVLVSVLEGRLVIEGDELANNIAITAGAEAGSFVISGLDGTTVHEGEAPAAEVTVTGVEAGVRVELGEGDDTMALADVSIQSNVSINMGEGNDTVEVGIGAGEPGEVMPDEVSVMIRGALRITTEGGNDEITVDDATIRGSLHVDAGDGDDTVSLGGMNGTVGVASLGGLGGLGGILNGEKIDARVHVRGSLHVDLGGGSNELDMNFVHAKLFASVEGGSEDDDINIGESQMLSLSVRTGDGMDTISLEGVRGGFVHLLAGDGNDDVSIVDSAFFLLGVLLGDGDDTLTTDGLSAKFATLLGGEGEDRLEELGVGEIKREIIRGFEIPPDINTSGFPGLGGLGRLRRLF